MSRVNNLFDLHKKRIARITDNYKELVVFYELRKPTGLKKDIVKNKLRSRFLNCDIEINFNKNSLSIKISQKESDLNKLYQIFLVIAYLLGNEVTLFYTYKNFPYYDIPHDFNFGNYPFCFVNNKRLIVETKKVLESGYKLLHKDDSFFSKLVPFLLSINTIQYSDVRFFAEFSALEFLASKSKISGLIFKSKEEKRKLKQFSEDALNCVSERLNNFKEINKPALKDKIEQVFTAERLNEKGVIRDKITDYIENLNSEHLRSYRKYVKDWSDLRNKKGLAHGNILKTKSKKDERDRLLENKLHEFLSEIVYQEFSEFSA